MESHKKPTLHWPGNKSDLNTTDNLWYKMVEIFRQRKTAEIKVCFENFTDYCIKKIGEIHAKTYWSSY